VERSAAEATASISALVRKHRGGRKPVAPTCREEVLVALAALETPAVRQVFTVREVYDEMAAIGTRYAETTVFKTMPRMKDAPARPPYARLERAGKAGFRLARAGT